MKPKGIIPLHYSQREGKNMSVATISKHHRYALGSGKLKNGFVLYLRPHIDEKDRTKMQVSNKYKSIVTARKNAYKLAQKTDRTIEIHRVYGDMVGKTVETVARTIGGNIRSESDIGSRWVNSDGSLRKHAQPSKARKYGWD